MAAKGFWLDSQAFQALCRSADVPTLIKGHVFLLLNDTQSAAVDRESGALDSTGSDPSSQWVKRFCTVKANLLGFAPHSDAPFEGAYLLEHVDVISLPAKEALIKRIIPALPPVGEGDHIVYVTNKRDRAYGRSIVPLAVALPSRGAAQSWKAAISEANFWEARTEAERLTAESRKELSLARRGQHKMDICVSKQEAELESFELEKQELMLEIQRLREKARRLQTSGEVTEKAAAEYVDQKVSEISALQCQLAEELRQKAVLKETLSELREHASRQQRRISGIEAENRQLATRYTELLRDLEEANDNPARIALVAARSRSSNQRLTLENKKLREENKALTRHFHEIEGRFDQKLAMVRKVAEAGDIFNFLRKWLLCSENKIKFYEMGYKMNKNEASDQRRKIRELQDELRIAEAVARSSYISVRSILLDEQLKSYTKHAEVPDVFSFVKTSLERFGWIFGEIEAVQPVDRVFGVELPHWLHGGEPPSKAPLLERIYPSGAIEGSTRFSLVKGVDVMKPVENMVPFSRFTAVETSLRLLEVDFKELEENYAGANEKLSECHRLIQDLRDGKEGDPSRWEHVGGERGTVLKPM
ncbi:conserved hypothetical protein [Neospora caninum Liverpool]|uniref:Uncharacterized protein n=1 Tax=Neospora caninum (strain Liverpool) TaxID=572307 RepID=F0VJX5_NEOCL|nr:conserved hypothetical protein [Neospora caninum Liverpool]CBZ54037.1 conserved hypothetical protein [Neospora caninum Liverpool]CEL68042.1 TPA: hypothetical protein BN1204_038180 [Neospora caninum Liverpool]|eukprot:XP_003884068.1 conserved hypothetical protein [Neospora caninum Liverpool]